MAATKKPQDHQAKAETLGADVQCEYNGVEYTIPRDVFNDVEILELIGDLQDNPLLLPKVVRTILGPEQWATFKDSNRNPAGRVHSDTLTGLFQAIDAAAGNSAASSTS